MFNCTRLKLEKNKKVHLYQCTWCSISTLCSNDLIGFLAFCPITALSCEKKLSVFDQMMCYFAHSLKVFVDLEVSFFLKAFFAWSVFKMRTWGVRQYFVSSHSRLLGRGGGTWQQEQPSLNCTALCQPRLWIKTQELELEVTDLGQGKLSSSTWENDRFGSVRLKGQKGSARRSRAGGFAALGADRTK